MDEFPRVRRIHRARARIARPRTHRRRGAGPHWHPGVLSVALDAYDRIAEPAIVIGHSMGGLLAQKIAAARSPLAAVLLAPVPPGVLWPRPRALPHLVPIMPRILAGKAFLPSARTMREVPLNTLPAAEQEELIPRLVRDLGRVFRELCIRRRVDEGEGSRRDLSGAVRQCRRGSERGAVDFPAHREALRRRAAGPSGQAALDHRPIRVRRRGTARPGVVAAQGTTPPQVAPADQALDSEVTGPPAGSTTCRAGNAVTSAWTPRSPARNGREQFFAGSPGPGSVP